MQGRPADAELVEHPHRVVLDQHVGVLDEAQERLPALPVAEVDGGGVLVAGVAVEEGVAVVGPLARLVVGMGVQPAQRPELGRLRPRRAAAGAVVEVGVLDPDDLGAEIAEQRGGIGPGPHDGQLQHPHALERQAPRLGCRPRRQGRSGRPGAFGACGVGTDPGAHLGSDLLGVLVQRRRRPAQRPGTVEEEGRSRLPQAARLGMLGLGPEVAGGEVLVVDDLRRRAQRGHRPVVHLGLGRRLVRGSLRQPDVERSLDEAGDVRIGDPARLVEQRGQFLVPQGLDHAAGVAGGRADLDPSVRAGVDAGGQQAGGLQRRAPHGVAVVGVLEQEDHAPVDRRRLGLEVGDVDVAARRRRPRPWSGRRGWPGRPPRRSGSRSGDRPASAARAPTRRWRASGRPWRRRRSRRP